MVYPCVRLFGSLVPGMLLFASAGFAAEVSCYIDSVSGDDTKSGLSEADAVKSQAKIPTTCTVVRYKRGSVFREKLTALDGATTYTNYGDPSAPLPKFQVPTQPVSGPVVKLLHDGITVDGLDISGARDNGVEEDFLMRGIGVLLGPNSRLLNSEIHDCGIGAALLGEGSVVRNNNIHDIIVIPPDPGCDCNAVPGGQGIVVSGGNSEIAYNSLVRCTGPVQWTGSDCAGGAIAFGFSSGLATRIEVHHNYAYGSCGFIAISGPVYGNKAKLTNSQLHNNVSIDSGAMALLQVGNMDFDTVQFYNNTIVQHLGATSPLPVVSTLLPGSMTGQDLQPNAIFLSNNLFALNGSSGSLHKNFVQATNLVIDSTAQDPGFINPNGTAAADFDLVAKSPAVNAGTSIPGNTLDYLDRPVPDPSGKTDIGAFEYWPTPPPIDGGPDAAGFTDGASPIAGVDAAGGAGGATGTAKPDVGGTSATGGASGTVSSPPGTGGTTILLTTAGSGGTSGSGGSNASSGCNCQLGAAAVSPTHWAGAIALAWLALRRRRRPF
jgi:MYXO-CTERM domain-containing protein